MTTRVAGGQLARSGAGIGTDLGAQEPRRSAAAPRLKGIREPFGPIPGQGVGVLSKAAHREGRQAMRLRKMLAIPVIVVALALAGVTGIDANTSATTPTFGWLGHVACSDVTHCWAVGANVDYLLPPLVASGGATWGLRKSPVGGGGGLYGVSCSSKSDCWLVGETAKYYPIILATSNGGTTWTTSSLPSLGTLGSLQSVSCRPSTTNCVAVGWVWHTKEPDSKAALILTTTNGVSWTSRTVPSGVSELDAISCASARDCVATGTTKSGSGVVVVTSNGGTTWTSHSSASLGVVSCPSTSDCWATGSLTNGPTKWWMYVTTNGGTTWRPQTLPKPVTWVSGVSCSNTKDCLTIGGEEAVATSNGGTTWKVLHTFKSSIGFTGVNCPSATVCVAVGATNVPAVQGPVPLVARTTNGGVYWKVQSLG